jgi:serine/threonine protein kinase
MVRGTRGYLAPEWVSNRPITVKADVYSYGMLLLEIVGGRRNLDMSFDAEDFFYPGWAFKVSEVFLLNLISYKGCFHGNNSHLI